MTRSGQAEGTDQALPGDWVYFPLIPDRGEGGHDLRARPSYLPISEFTDHPGKPMFILVPVELSGVPHLADLAEFRGNALRGDGSQW